MDREQLVALLNNYFDYASCYVDDIWTLIEGLPYVTLGDQARVLYIIGHYVVTHCNERQLDVIRYINYMCKSTTNYISPYAKLSDIIINGSYVYIDGCVVCSGKLIVGSHCVLGKSHNTQYNDNISLVIGNNCILGNNIRVYPNIVIGDNVIINDNAIIKENLTSNVEVDIVNQLQLKHSSTATLPSQILTIYGIVPKFRNCVTILGEGFYNPKVLIKAKNGKAIDYDLTYWDKNKIILKFKGSTPILTDGTLLILLSNGNKITLINNFGLEKALKSLN